MLNLHDLLLDLDVMSQAQRCYLDVSDECEQTLRRVNRRGLMQLYLFTAQGGFPSVLKCFSVSYQDTEALVTPAV